MSDPLHKGLLPVNLDDLIHQRVIEAQRLDYKATWDDQIKKSVIHTICAFANDLLNLNGGYIILGVAEQAGAPVLPPRGLDEYDVERIQKEISGDCKGRISPEYLPILSVESFQGKTILVIWAPPGDNRPYEAPDRNEKKKVYWVRSGAQTIEATGDLRRQLLEQAAKIPFDDRRSLTGQLSDLSFILVKRFLSDIRSQLSETTFSSDEIYRKLRLLVKLNDHEIPKNIALLFFSEKPEQFFPGARLEVVQFGDDAGGDLIEEKIFRGSLPEQIHSSLSFLDGLGGTLRKKVPGQAEVERTVPYPYEAMEEAIVNAVYHRSYEAPPEPIKIYLYPDRMEITSYPGPVPGIDLVHLKSGKIPPVPARNRRIGDFLKDLRLAEGRGTGIPKIQRKMKENGSPQAIFDFDDQRTYFRVILPVHPRYQVLHALREAAHLWAIGEKNQALAHLEQAFDQRPSSGALAGQIIEYAFGVDRIEMANKAIEKFEAQTGGSEMARPYLTMARLLLDRKKNAQAQEVLKRLPSSSTGDDLLELAILKKRIGDFEGAHRFFTQAYPLLADDPKTIHEFAQTKNKLAARKRDPQVRKRLNQEAEELLRRAIQLGDDNIRKAWCWFDLARTLEWLKAPKSEIEEAFLKAMKLLPNETAFSDKYNLWKSHNHANHR